MRDKGRTGDVEMRSVSVQQEAWQHVFERAAIL